MRQQKSAMWQKKQRRCRMRGRKNSRSEKPHTADAATTHKDAKLHENN